MNQEAFLAEIRALFPSGHPDFYKKVVELCDLHSRKNGDYASNEDPMSNFNRVGMLTDAYDVWGWDVSSSLKVATIYMLKQFDAFMNLLKCKKEGKVEGVSDRLGDVTVYSIIMDILYRESQTPKDKGIGVNNDSYNVREFLKDLLGEDKFSISSMKGKENFTLITFKDATQDDVDKIHIMLRKYAHVKP